MNIRFCYLLLVVGFLFYAPTSNAESVQLYVWLDVSINESGAVESVELVEDLPNSVESFLSTWARDIEFEPASVDGKAARSTTSVWAKLVGDEQPGGLSFKIETFKSGPRPLQLVQPRYPDNLAINRKQGYAEVEFTVTSSGDVKNVVVTESSDSGFHKPTIRAIKKWKFKPRTVNGNPVATQATQRIDYSVE